MELKGSRTEANLMSAFAGETQARTKYSYFAEKAKEEGFEKIADVFYETAHNEKAHAKIWFEILGALGTTEQNLENAAAGEHFEWAEMYREFAETAKSEGFERIAFLFESVAAIEKQHDERYKSYIDEIKNQKCFLKESETVWKCMNCGYEYTGKGAPAICPVCSHPQAYFEDEGKSCSI